MRTFKKGIAGLKDTRLKGEEERGKERGLGFITL